MPDKVTCAAVFTHGLPERIGDSESGVHELAAELGVELSTLGEGAPDLVVALAAPGWQALVLVKPQFEAGRAEVPKGVVRDPELHRRVLREFCAAAGALGARVAGVVDSGHPGPKGNREFVVHLIASEEPSDPDDIERRIDAAVG
jgi:hypothetical protein